MRHWAVWRSAMPMALIRWNPDDIARQEFLNSFTFRLNQTTPGNNN